MTILLEPKNLTELKNHWWWRPGWQVGRHYYACHITFPAPAHDDLRRIINEYQSVLTPFTGVDPIPAQWLHLTLQGVGFIDQVPDQSRDGIIASLHDRLREIEPFEVVVQRPTIGAEAITLHVQPSEPVYALRSAVHAAIADVRGDEAPPQAPNFRPHVSIAYIADQQPAEPVRRALASIEPAPATIPIRGVPLLDYHRDNRMYEWRELARFALG